MIWNVLSYPRAVIMAALYPVFLFLSSVTCILVNLIFNQRSFDDFVLKWWGRVSCAMFGVEVRVEGLENIPEGGAVFLFNHTSFFDIFALAGYLSFLRFGAKVELFRIPLFGRAMRRIGVIPIARNRREEVFRLYRESEARLKHGEKIALAPEGTRQTDGRKIGNFKSGPFIFAISAKVPVVPVVIQNASEILPKNSLFPNWGTWKREIVLTILPPVQTQNLDIEDRPILQGRVRDSMLEFIGERPMAFT